jgi:P-type Mg2+ transporter
MKTQQPPTSVYWSRPSAAILDELSTSLAGLTSNTAAERLKQVGSNRLIQQKPPTRLKLLSDQLRSPLVLILVFAALIALVTQEWVEATVILMILSASIWVSFSREHNASRAIEELRARISHTARVYRDNTLQELPTEQLVPGDIIVLSAGNLVPADALLLEATDCFVNQAVLTGETFPVKKQCQPVTANASLTERTNCVFSGTNVQSGTARCVVTETGARTMFGGIAEHLSLRSPETEFERGLRHFGYLLMTAMLIIVLSIFAVNVLLERPIIETLLFAVALAVGLSPELLPAILSINLASAAREMAKQGVLVRHLNAIENLGSMDILCTDKTGTLTKGVVSLEGAYNTKGEASPEVLQTAALNSLFQAGLANPLDVAILQSHKPEVTGIEKLGEIPYDFVRKRLSVIIRTPAGVKLVTKGAFTHVLESCTQNESGTPLTATQTAALQEHFLAWSERGVRVIAVACRDIPEAPTYQRTDEQGLSFLGFLTFTDEPKEGAEKALQDLAALGVSVKLIPGDSQLVAVHIAKKIGLSIEKILTGKQLDELHDEALWHSAEKTNLFVEVDPNQKERIVLSLKKMGHVVGFMGDGINDASAMHAADTSISAEDAVDVAREAADFVLLRRDLDIIRRGILQGRQTFANSLKYIMTTTSANLGNMISMAVASLFLPFLPLTASQILLNNFLSDIPAVGIAQDSVDPEMIERPRRWSMRFIGRFMVEFGLLSSLFDFLAFGMLLYLFRVDVETFRTGWFVESLLTELAVALVLRTRRRFYQSRPGRLLLITTGLVAILALLVPYLPFASLLGFTPLPLWLTASLVGLTALYVMTTEFTKVLFYHRASKHLPLRDTKAH